MTRLNQSIVSGMDKSISGGRIGGHHENGVPSALSYGAATRGGSRPGLSFPLGTGLVVLIILLVSALFSFCYHWLSLRKRRRSSQQLLVGSSSPSTAITISAPLGAADLQQPPSFKEPPVTITKLDMVACPPVVYMAGDYMPRYIAVPRPLADVSMPSTKGEDVDSEKKPPSNGDLKLDVRL